MSNLVKIKVTPPPPPVSLGEVQLTMPAETAIALAGLLAQMPLAALDTKFRAEDALFSVFSALYREFGDVGSSTEDAYANAKGIVNSVISVTRVDR